MEDAGSTQASTTTAAAPARSTCSACGALASTGMPSQGYVTLVGNATMAFPNLAVEKEFAQLLGRRDFTGFTDRQTLHGVLSQPENRYLAREMCALFTLYGSGQSPAYIVMPKDHRDLDFLVDTLKRPANKSEFDVVEGRIAGIAPPQLCNAQELPIAVFSHFYSFPVEELVKKIPRSEKTEKIKAERFEEIADDTFHRIMRMASNGVGPIRALTFAALSYPGLYEHAAAKHAENSSLADIGVSQSRSNPDHAVIRLKFVRRDTGFSETYRFTVNFAGQFAFMEELLHPSYDIS